MSTMRWLGVRHVTLSALYGVRVNRMGALRAPLRMTMTVNSFLPSRMGTIAVLRTKSASGRV